MKQVLHKVNDLSTHLLMGLFMAVLLLAIALGVRSFNEYTQDQLYQECLTQLSEITTQMYEKIGILLDNQWTFLYTMEDSLGGRELTSDQLAKTFAMAERQLTPRNDSLTFLALDEHGNFYSDTGRNGIWSAIDDLDPVQIQQSFLVNDWEGGENQMAFVYKISNPITIASARGDVPLTHLVLLKDMSILTPYFRSSAFHNRNTTYVLKSSGVKMYSDNVVDAVEFQGRNVYHALRELTYPHSGSFDACLEQLDATSYICTDVVMDGAEYYLCLKKLDGYDWTMLFLVPSDEVAASTRDMIQSIVKIFVIALVSIVLLCFVGMIFVTQLRRNRMLLAVKTESAARLAQSNAELEKAQKATVEALNLAESASKAKTDFLSNMSHDIRTPMNAIVGISTLMENELDQPDRLREHIHKLQMSSQHLLGLINDILDMNKIESGKTVLRTESIHLPDQLEQISDMIRPQVREKSQTLSIVTRDIVHEDFLADATRLRQVLINILSNAVKYTPDGGQITFTVAEMPRNGPSYAKYVFTIADNGIGMTEEFQKKIFEPFVRAESSLTNKVQGTGLGMSITKSIVELMGGTIHLESAPGKGSTFEVVLEFPIDTEVKARAAADNTPALTGKTSSLHGMKFLCAEDNALNAEILEALLECEGAACTVYSDGQQIVDAFAAVKPGDYDAILMDVQMPVMDGYEATRRIRSGANPLGRTIPIFAMTANAFSDDIQHSLDAGMNAHLSKPINMKELEKTVTSFT